MSARTKDHPRSFKEVDDELHRWIKRVAALLLLLLLLMLVLGLAYGLWIGLSNASQDSLLNELRTNVTSAQNSLTQLLVEMNGNVTVLQRGNFSWVMAKTFGTQSPEFQACTAAPDYVSQGLLNATYQLQNVQIGLLNWTVLVLQPPSTPLVYTSPTDDASALHVCMTTFTPTIDILDTLNVNGPRIYEFTASNLARLSLTPTSCAALPTCSIIPYVNEAFTGTSAYSITSAVEVDPNPDDFYLEFFYKRQSGSFSLGAAFTVLEPLQLMLPSS